MFSLIIKMSFFFNFAIVLAVKKSYDVTILEIVQLKNKLASNFMGPLKAIKELQKTECHE